MGWARENLSQDARERIASSLFVVERTDGDWLNGLCPLHPDTNSSFGYNFVDDVFHCLAACNDNGDLVALWCLCKGYDPKSKDGFKAFKSAYAADMGFAPARKTPGQATRKERRQEKARVAIPEDVYKAMGPIPDDFMAELRIRRGWTREAVERLGLRMLTHYRKKSTPFDLFPITERDRVVFPVRDAAGVLWNLRTYYPFGIPDYLPPKIKEKAKKIISWAMGHGYARLFPSPAFLRDSGPILLAEGEPDCTCARSQGLDNTFTQTSKTAEFPQDQLQMFKDRDVVIAYDADNAGQKYAQNHAKALLGTARSVRIVEWPDFMGRQPDGTWPEDHGQDLTDYFVKHHKTDHEFRALMEKATLFGVQEAKALDSTMLEREPWRRFWRDSVNGRWSFSEKFLADYLLEKCPILYHDKSGQLYRWEDSNYEPYSEESMKREAIEALGDEAAASKVNASCSLALSMASMPTGRDLNDRADWVCLQNGMFNIHTLELVPHSPDFMSTIKLGVSWHDADAPRPVRWLHFLEETIQTPEVIDQVQEYFGYAMTRDTRFGKALLLLGPGADGKSKMLAVLRALVGPQNCSAVSMSGLDDQFQRAALFGKILNVATEITTDAIQSEMFKAIVTGDPIQASFKHKDSFGFVPFAKLVYATNKMPRVFDNSDGYFRRILPVQFKRQFLEGDVDLDTDLEAKLMEELDGIFAWAVMGLHRLIAQKGFTKSDETQEFMMRYRRYNNPVMGFVQDCCTLEHPAAETELKKLYAAYKSYCSEGGFRPANRENFFEELQTAVRKLKEDAAIRRHRPRRGKERPDLIEGIYLQSTSE